MHKLALFWWVGGMWSCVQISVVAILVKNGSARKLERSPSHPALYENVYS